MAPGLMRPHIVFFNRSFFPDNAATGQLLTELCESLVEDYGYRVTVVAGLSVSAGQKQSRFSLISRETYRNIEVLRASGTRLSTRRFWGRACNYATYFLSACLAALRVDRPDIVVALTDPPIIGLAGYICSKWFRAKFVMSYQDIFPEVGRLLDDFHSKRVDSILQSVNCFLVSAADHVTALGTTMRRRLIESKKADPSKVSVIPSWIDSSQIQPGPKINEFARHHHLSSKFVVMHSGNIGFSQGLENIIKAATYLTAFPDIQVVFIGDGVRRASLEDEANALNLHNVKFLPYQPKDQLSLSWSTADVFLVSLKRGLAGYIVPSKLYGILAAGRPYVAAVEEDCEVALISNEFECGLVVEPENPFAIAQKILTLYNDPGLRMRMGENGRRASFQFDRKIQVEAYHKLFASLS